MTHDSTNNPSNPQATGLARSVWANSKSSSRGHHYRPWPRSAPPSELRAQSPAKPPPPTTNTPGTTAAVANAISSSRTLSPAHALRRFEQICHRLRWKRIDLEQAYNRALNWEEWGFTQMDAERNFKVDFHEFYAVIEQAVVLVLVVFDIPIASTWSGGGWKHAYHQDVLRAVEEDDGPLGMALGRGEVVQAFWKAKELRNRWKGVHVDGEEAGPPLGMYHLSWIVKEILGGLEVVYVLAKEKVQEVAMEGNSSGDGTGEESWEWMVESMDWEEN